MFYNNTCLYSKCTLKIVYTIQKTGVSLIKSEIYYSKIVIALSFIFFDYRFYFISQISKYDNIVIYYDKARYLTLS